MASATFPGNSNYRLDLSTWVSGTTLNGSISVTKTAGSGYWTASAQPWSMNIAGNGFSGSWTYDFRSSTPQTIGIATRSAGVGYGWQVVSASVTMASGIGTASTSEGQQVAGTPNAPGGLSWNSSVLSTCNLGLNYSRGGDNGSAIVQDEVQWATDAGFSNVVWSDGGASGYSSPSCGSTPGAPALLPGTTYYVRVRSRNGVGWGGWSSTASATTLPADPPGMTVTAAASGQSATVAMTPPGGASGVTKYTVERRPLPAATPTTSTDSTGNSQTITGLTPGVQYEWRASAWFGTYQSPWTAWTAVQQPNPNTSPGDFFDGNKAAIADVTYSWTGMANNSTSRATGRGVDGWAVDLTASGGTAVCQQVTGGYVGTSAARMVMKTDATAAGARLGMANATGKRAAVLATAQYVGSIFVKPSRAQRLAARIVFTDAAGTAVGSATVGTAQQVTSTTTWTRLNVAATAPAGAAFALVTAIDVSGTGWSAWLSGEFLDADAAMVSLQALFPYFDGSTPDTTLYAYEWMGAANASASRRLTPPEQPFVVQDPDCAVVPSAPLPPQIENDCIVTIGEWLRYSYSIPALEVSEWLAVVPTIELSTLGAAATQVRVRFYRNPTGGPISSFTDWDDWESELYLSYMPPNAVVTLDGITQAATADVSGHTGVPMDHLMYGSDGGVVTWPLLTCGDAYIMTVDTPIDLPPGGLSVAVDLRQRA